MNRVRLTRPCDVASDDNAVVGPGRATRQRGGSEFDAFEGFGWQAVRVLRPLHQGRGSASVLANTTGHHRCGPEIERAHEDQGVRPRFVAGMASASIVSAQVLVADGGTAGAASSHQFGILTTGYDLSVPVNPIEFDPDPVHQLGLLLLYDWPIYAGLLRETTSGSYVPDLAPPPPCRTPHHRHHPPSGPGLLQRHARSTPTP